LFAFLLKYRYEQLDKAIENAEKLGFTAGAALYPMVTMNGEECHNEWEITFEEIHRNGAIAYAIFNYISFTEDVSYVAEMGLEVLIGIARFWAQRVSFSTPKKKYVILGVTGPNEYENNVNNNWYTNYIARWCLEYAAVQTARVENEFPKDFARIQEKTKLTEKECAQWMEIAAQMYLPYDDEKQIYLQQDSFLDKTLVPAAQLPPGQRPINQHWSWDRILRSPYIKQADVLQGFYFFESDFTFEELQRHYDFYEPLTVHESSLSPCVHSILAARLQRMDDAYRFYLQTARLDLDDYNKEVHEGLHITSMAGTWMSIVEGFAGMQMQEGVLAFRPQLPKQWESFSFKIFYKNAPLQVRVAKGGCQFIWGGSQPIPILINGKKQRLQSQNA
jgi:maltose phosphorylase